MSSEETPPPSANGNGTPIKLSLGTTKGFNLAKKKAPLVNKTAVAAFGHQEEKVDTQKDELIVGLDGNKIESLEPTVKTQPLVIPKLENANWREQVLAKRKKIFSPQEGRSDAVDIVEEPVKEVGYGLQIKKRTKVEHTTSEDNNAMQIDTISSTSTMAEVTEVAVIEEKEESLDELAARKIIEAATGERAEEARRLILQNQQNVDDVDAFQKNLEDLPDEASLEDYEKVPVEEFGAALLRGMGWNGDMKGSEAIEYNRRPALLGLGAKPKEPEPITKKYIKPGESRTPQAINVPQRNTTGRSGTTSYQDNKDRDRNRDRDIRGNRDSRDSKSSRDDRDTKDSRVSRDDRDTRDSRSSRDDRDTRDSRSSRDDRDTRDSRSSRDNRNGRDKESHDSRDSRDRDYRRDHRDSRSSREERDERHSRSTRDAGRDRERDSSRDKERGRDRDSKSSRDRDRERDIRRP
ncbi:hypothetical protein BGZ49_000687 [Haplosporangium sp. Z 27]|nr:hypothetical protein BGZ49_000687 [Haplosporangium sp. Z 27]